jgi:hypothetical protein
MLFVLGCYSTFHFCRLCLRWHPAPAELDGFFKKKQISNYILFSFIILCSHNNIDVISYSRLTAGQSVADCLNKCRANQECYSFNYNKVTKWCYLGTTEEVMLRQTRNSKWAAGYRRCVEQISNDPWTNDEFSGGSSGTGPNPVKSITVVDSGTANNLDITIVAPDTLGTTADGSASTLKGYRITCSSVSGSSSYPAVTRTLTVLTGSIPGLAVGQKYTCSAVVVNAEGVESSAVVSSAVEVA